MKTYSAIVSILLFSSGCVVAPFIDGAHRAGVTESSRRTLLPEQVQNFTNKLSSGRVEPALAFVESDSLPTLSPVIRNSAINEKIVDGKVEDINFGESAYDADVTLRVRYFKVPVYVVKDRVEHQNWSFSATYGWQLKSITRESDAG